MDTINGSGGSDHSNLGGDSGDGDGDGDGDEQPIGSGGDSATGGDSGSGGDGGSSDAGAGGNSGVGGSNDPSGAGGDAGTGGSGLPEAVEIARELLNPSHKYHLIVIGDSRQTVKQDFVLSEMTSIPWVGSAFKYLSSLDATNGAHDSENQLGTANQPNSSPWLGPGTSAGFPVIGGIETRFTGVAEPSAGDNCLLMRLGTAAPLTAANAPLLWEAFEAGGDVQVHLPFWRHPGAMSSAPGVRLSLRTGGTNFSSPGHVQGPYVHDMTGAGYDLLTLTAADGYDWTSYTAPFIEIVAAPGAATHESQTAALGTPSIERTGPGIVYYPIAAGGWAIEGAGGVGGWLDERVVPAHFWYDYFATFVNYPIFWIDLGTNNPNQLTQAAHASKVQQLIERLRQAWPLAPVILTSAFASSQSGDNPYYRAAAADIAAEVDGILYLDTYGALPNYADGVAAGYYGDQVHYNATGDRALFRAIDELIVTAAQY